MKKFPGFGGLGTGRPFKPGAVSLALHGSKSNQYGRWWSLQYSRLVGAARWRSPPTPRWSGPVREPVWYADGSQWLLPTILNNAIRWLAADRIQRKTGDLIGFPAGPFIGETVPLTQTTVALPGGQADFETRSP